MKYLKNKNLIRAVSVLLALLAWQAAAWAVNMEMLLASPLQVLIRLFSLVTEPGFFGTILVSSGRILLGFLIALLAGFFLALFSGRFPIIEDLLRPYIAAMKSVPVASFIILCLIWFSYEKLTVFIAFLIAFPLLYRNVLQGIRSADRNLIQAADLFRVNWLRRLKYILLPSVKPYLLSACGTAVGMAWKAGMAAEVIGVIGGSIGEKLYEAKVYFQNADLLAWTVMIILLSVLTEKLFTVLTKNFFRELEKR